MKAAFVLLVFGVCVALSNAGLTCWRDKDKCEEDECCVKLSYGFGICKKRKAEDASCPMLPAKQILKDHVYLFECPCEEGLTCVKKEGAVGHVRGTCQAGSGENGGGEE